MDWFQRITGFREAGYDETRAQLSVVDGRLHSRHSDRRCAVGRLSTPTLAQLRREAGPWLRSQARSTVRCVAGDARQLHGEAAHAGATFQVASQFNLLEMVDPSVGPEDGVTRYEGDPTQGPACAMAAGAGTIYRNYLAPVQGRPGQTRDRQIDCLREVGDALGNAGERLWRMRNGYCLVGDAGLAAIDDRLAGIDADERERLTGLLRVGVNAGVEVTDAGAGHLVHQVYCSALPVAYHRVREPERWARFAGLVLDAAYEATLLSAAVTRATTGNGVVHLTKLGGGAFGNDPRWIVAALRRALSLAAEAGLDVRLVSRGPSDPEFEAIASEFGA